MTKYGYTFTYEKVEDFGYYVVRINGELIFNFSIDKLPNNKFGIYDGYNSEYIVKNETLKFCKEEFARLFASDELYKRSNNR